MTATSISLAASLTRIWLWPSALLASTPPIIHSLISAQRFAVPAAPSLVGFNGLKHPRRMRKMKITMEVRMKMKTMASYGEKQLQASLRDNAELAVLNAVKAGLTSNLM